MRRHLQHVEEHLTGDEPAEGLPVQQELRSEAPKRSRREREEKGAPV